MRAEVKAGERMGENESTGIAQTEGLRQSWVLESSLGRRTRDADRKSVQ